MLSASPPSVQRFSFTIRNIRNIDQVLVTDVPIPFTGNVPELAQAIIDQQHDPMISVMDLQDGLIGSLKDFICENNQAYYDRRDSQLLADARSGSIDVDRLIKALDTQYKDEIHQDDSDDTAISALQQQCTEFGEAEQFSQRFHRLVHSAQLTEILQREQQYAQLIADTKLATDGQLAALYQRQQDDMEVMVEQLDVSTTPEDINRLLTRQYSELNRVRGEREAELAALKGHQRSEYHQWIEALDGGGSVSGSDGAGGGRRSASTATTPVNPRPPSMCQPQSPQMEESFTIHLGSQLKYMHNIRILAGDITRLCGPLHAEEDSLCALNQSLGLYSCALTGVVVLTPVGQVQINAAVHQNANMSTDFHFAQVDDQLSAIQRRLNRLHGPSNSSTTSSADSTPTTETAAAAPASNSKLRPGDFFVTRHSNLAQAHIIFHLITDEAFAHSAEINSRHPVILGLRNVMKTACRHDVTLLTIPTLLRHSMSEDMTVPWCTRRAELVFKCAKGFMIESASWGGSQLSTLQLLLPHDISEELFAMLAGMVPHIFRVANPKFLVGGG